MRAQSLRWRLGLIGAVAILVALALSVLGLTYLFDRHVERVAVADLEARALSVVAMIDPGGANGPIFRATQGDPLYDQPFSGHYWQITLGDEVRRSRSLWDFAFPAVTTQSLASRRTLAWPCSTSKPCALPTGNTQVMCARSPGLLATR